MIISCAEFDGAMKFARKQPFGAELSAKDQLVAELGARRALAYLGIVMADRSTQDDDDPADVETEGQ
jgi:hypothetical protein